MDINGVPVLVDPLLSKGMVVLIDLEGCLPRPHIRTDSMESMREFMKAVEKVQDNIFLNHCGISNVTPDGP
jgi:hypothetical protein